MLLRVWTMELGYACLGMLVWQLYLLHNESRYFETPVSEKFVISPLKTNIVKRFQYQKTCVGLVKLLVFESLKKCLSIEWRAFIWDRCRKKVKTWYTGIQELLVGVNYFTFTGYTLSHSNSNLWNETSLNNKLELFEFMRGMGRPV